MEMERRRSPNSVSVRVQKMYGDPGKALDKLIEGAQLLRAAMRGKGAEIVQGRAEFDEVYIAAKLAEYSSILEMHYDHYMASAEWDKACHVMMVLNKQYASMLSGRRPAAALGMMTVADSREAEDVAAGQTDEELARAVRE